MRPLLLALVLAGPCWGLTQKPESSEVKKRKELTGTTVPGSDQLKSTARPTEEGSDSTFGERQQPTLTHEKKLQGLSNPPENRTYEAVPGTTHIEHFEHLTNVANAPKDPARAEDELNRLKAKSAAEMKRDGAISPDTAVETAEALAQAGSAPQAEKLYRAALRARPEDPRALTGMALVQAQQGRGPEAVATAKRALAVDPANPLAKLIVGHSETLGKADGAAERLGKLGLGAFEGGLKTAEAGGAPERGPQAAPKPAPLYDLARPLSPAQQLVMKALQRLAIGDKKEALLLVTQALELEPNDAKALVVRAEIGNALGNHKGAIADATKALQLAPGDAPLDARALRARAYARLESGDLEGALADAHQAVLLEPGSGLGYLYRAMALQRLNRAQEALLDARRAVELDPALEPLAAPLLAKLAPPPAELPRVVADPRLLRRAGLIGLSVLLIVAGLAGTASGRKLTTTAARSLGFGARAQDQLPAGAALGPGDFIGGSYRVVREVGRGGMGVVYEAHDETLQRRVAIKRMQGGDGTDVQRFLREARLVAQLKHPHLAEIYNVVLHGEPFLIFEYVEGRGLDAVLREAGRLPAAQARRVVGEICQALEYAHARNIIHRDLKPSNVMLTADGACKVMDFGIAHQSRGAATMTQTAICGTPAYMAPEQHRGAVSKASDLYALGIIAHELLTGSRPVEGGPALPKALEAFFAKALAPDPKARFSAAGEFRAAFERALDGTPSPGTALSA